MLNLSLTAMAVAVAVLSLIATFAYRRRAQRAEAALTPSPRPLAGVTVAKTQEILPSRYRHNQTSTRMVSPSPLIRRTYCARHETEVLSPR